MKKIICEFWLMTWREFEVADAIRRTMLGILTRYLSCEFKLSEFSIWALSYEVISAYNLLYTGLS